MNGPRVASKCSSGGRVMRSLRMIAIFIALLFGLQSLARPASAAQTDKGRGSISGQVKVDGKAASGITVMATPSITDPAKAVEAVLNKSASLKATTDSEGRYKFEDIPAGKYTLAPFAPTMVSNISPGIEVTVTDGNASETIDFSL